ncbi:MAG: phosphatidylserine/phosphatidylglycerophosphate/cardiolipin synthase family protein [Holophaga sp.]
MPQRVIPATTSFIRRRVASLWQRLLRYGERHRLPVSEGNDVRLLPSGTEILGCLRTLIGRAQLTVHFEIYEWADDTTGRDLMTSLQEAQSRGVEVRGVVDHLGSWGAVRMIKASGLDVRFFHPIGWRLPWRLWRRRNHRKLLIADGTRAMVGSANWSNEYNDEIPPKYYRDLGIELQGPAIEQLEADFLKSWRRAGGTMPEPRSVPGTPVAEPGWHCDVPVQIASSLWGGRWAIRHHFLLILRQLQKRAVFANAYFIPDPQFLQVLLRMARRGVGVDLIAPGNSDHPFAQAASRATFGRLLRAGVRIWERRERVFHAKVALLDEDLVLIGTANLDSFSFKRNLELNLMVRSMALANALQKALDEDRAHSRLLTLDEWLALPAYRSAFQNLAYLFWWWL